MVDILAFPSTEKKKTQTKANLPRIILALDARIKLSKDGKEGKKRKEGRRGDQAHTDKKNPPERKKSGEKPWPVGVGVGAEVRARVSLPTAPSGSLARIMYLPGFFSG